ncbi:MAG TPA: FAD-dependent oxidoreductase, partial [Terriglobia bacterium]|nr:FAD-dependent oxidoreductase [Terriglobia bacterium]
MKEQAPFDIAIIGAGPGGYVAAIRAGQLGLKTVVIERDSRYGGTCTLRGCIPTKALLRDAHLFQEVKRAMRQGLFTGGELQFDFSKIQNRKDDVVTKSSKGVDFLLKKNKATVIRGEAKLTSPGKIQVKGDNASMSEVEARNIIIATGSEARSLPGYDLDEKHIISNIGALNMASVPASLVIVGAGAVGVEFASIYNAFGTKVTIIEVLPELMALEDAEVSKELRRVLTRKGIDVHTKAKLESAKAAGDGVEVVFQTEAGEARKLLVDKILMATGRAPNSATIGLGSVGVALERGFIKVDRYMQTSVAGIYAIGDVVPTPLLA